MAQKVPLSDLTIPPDSLEGFYRGVVEDNKDPLNSGRCRCRILGVHPIAKTPEDDAPDSKNYIPTEELPWAHQVTGLTGNASSSIPQQGAYVFLFFENGNPSQPRYFGIAPGTEAGNPKIAAGKANSLGQENGENKTVDDTICPAADPNANFIGFLVRTKTDDQGTVGTLTIHEKKPDGSKGMIVYSATTLELPWRNNASGMSCFRNGVYNCKYTASGSNIRLTKTYIIEGTPGRAGCRLHNGMWAGDKLMRYRADVQGCILLGVNTEENRQSGSHPGPRQRGINNGTKVCGLATALKEKPFVLTVSGVCG